jgi:uncharacterized protein
MNKQFEHLPGEFLNKSQIVVVMVNSLEGLSIEEYSNKLFSEWGIGDGEKDNGALLLIAKNDGEIRIEVGYGLEPVITDGRAGRILDNQMLPHLANKDFNAGVLAGFVSMIELIAEEDGVTIQGLESFTKESYEEDVYPDDSDSILFEDLSTGQTIAIIVPILLFALLAFLLSVAPFIVITALIIYVIKGVRNGTIQLEKGSSSSHSNSSSRSSRSLSSSRSSLRSRSSGSRGGGRRSGDGGSSRKF